MELALFDQRFLNRTQTFDLALLRLVLSFELRYLASQVRAINFLFFSLLLFFPRGLLAVDLLVLLPLRDCLYD